MATRRGFANSCTVEVGRLLGVLASHVRGGVIGEIGTGCGVGASWMVGNLAPDTRFVTVEADEEQAIAVGDLFKYHRAQVQVIHGDWHEILAHGPFDLLFVDAAPAKAPPGGEIGTAAEKILDALRPGGLIVLDDLSPEERWPPEWRGKPDPVRAYWLNEPRLNATEVLVTPAMVVILATRVG